MQKNLKIKICLLFLSLFFSKKIIAQKVEFSGTPTAIISNSAVVPHDKKLFFSSGLTASAIDTSLAEGNYAKYGDTKTQAINILIKFKSMLSEKGLSLNDVFSMRVYLTPDVKTGQYDFDGWNAAYKQYFGTKENPTKPTRATLGISALANRFKFIEIELVATYP
jgi:enamine deaminase RidA (YjgF/YER057c/UK114 family)